MPDRPTFLTSALGPLLPRNGYVITPVLMGLQVLVWVAMVVLGTDPLFPDSMVLLDWGANLGARVADGQVWRLFSSIFLPAGVLQLVLNLAVLAVLGMSLEWRMGYVRFLLGFLLTGACGGLASAVLSGQVLSVGAAPALFGLLGLQVSLIMLKAIPPKFKRAALVLVPLFLLANLLNFSLQGVDHWANIGGFTAGLLLAPFLRIGMRAVKPKAKPAEVAPVPEPQIEITPLVVPATPDLIEDTAEDLPADAEAATAASQDAPQAEEAVEESPVMLPEAETPVEEPAQETPDPLVLPIPGELNTFGDAPTEA